MPQIRVTINDNTGTEVTTEESVVFITGNVGINSKYIDNNNCVYISASQYSKLNGILVNDGEDNPFKSSDLEKADAYTLGTIGLIENCLEAGLDVIYCYVKQYGPRKTIPSADEGGLKFLYDKDTYNVKFLTSGYLGSGWIIKDDGGNTDALSDGWNEGQWEGSFTAATTLGDIASKRTDCSVLTSLNYYKEPGQYYTSTGIDSTEGHEGATQYSGTSRSNGECILPLIPNVKNGDIAARNLSSLLYNEEENTTLLDHGDYTYILFPNIITNVNLGISFDNLSTRMTMPSFYDYLIKYAQALKNGQEWLPLANSTRGGLTGLGTPDLTCTKYCFDENIIKDRKLEDLHVEKGVSFNGIVELKPYGQVIWGDRTCMLIDETVKATAYQSLRMLLCDVSKRAYQAAVRYTYESNNEVTWFNFKSRVTELLSEMVASGVLSGFDMRRQPSPTLNTIVCKITLYPNLPVENFDIYINLENAEVTTENGEDVEE